MNMTTLPGARRSLAAWIAGAALATSLAVAAPAAAQPADDAWAAMTADLTALVDEAAADNVRMGISVIDLSGTYGGADMTVGNTESYKAASLIKLPLLALLMSMVDEGTLSLDEVVTIPAGDPNIVGGAGTLRDRTFPVDITIEELMTLMVQVSDNTATNVLIDRAGGFPAVNGSSRASAIRRCGSAGR